MTPWPQVLEQLQGRAFPGFSELVSEATRLRGRRVTTDSLGQAWKRHGLPGTPSVLVGETWEGEETTPSHPQTAEPFPIDMLPDLYGDLPPRETYHIDSAPGDVFAILGDVHLPIIDRRAVNAVNHLLHDLRPRVILQGDTFDNEGMSRFAAGPGGKSTLIDEVIAAQEWLRWLADNFETRMLLGNHEGRLSRWISDNPWAYDHPAFDPRELFKIPGAIQLYPHDAMLRFGDCIVEHGHCLKLGGQYKAAAAYRRRPGMVTVFGHHHRLDAYRVTVNGHDGKPRTVGAFCCGHLQNLRAAKDWCPDANWQHGLVLVHCLPERRHQVTVLEVVDGLIHYGGKVYGSP